MLEEMDEGTAGRERHGDASDINHRRLTIKNILPLVD